MHMENVTSHKHSDNAKCRSYFWEMSRPGLQKRKEFCVIAGINYQFLISPSCNL